MQSTNGVLFCFIYFFMISWYTNTSEVVMKRVQKYIQILKEYFDKLWRMISLPEMRILPGHLAFFFVLSTIPIITLIGLICSMFSISIVDVVNSLGSVIPHGVIEVLEPFMNIPASSISTWFLILGFFLASNGAYSVMLASNTLYKFESTNYIRGRIKAIFLTIILMILFLFVLVVLAFGNAIVRFVLDLEMFQNVAANIYPMFVLFKWPIAFIIIFILVKLIYTLAPNRAVSSRYVNKGAVFTTVGWTGVTAVYAYYADHLANYNLFYGSLSNIIILMMWIYFVSYIFVIGIAINSSFYNYRHSQKEKISINNSLETGESIE